MFHCRVLDKAMTTDDCHKFDAQEYFWPAMVFLRSLSGEAHKLRRSRYSRFHCHHDDRPYHDAADGENTKMNRYHYHLDDEYFWDWEANSDELDGDHHETTFSAEQCPSPLI